MLPNPAPSQAAGALLYLQQNVDGTTLRNRQVAFLPDQATPGPVELIATFDQGAILFLGQALLNEAAFTTQLRRLLSTPSFSPSQLLWIANPNDRTDLWKIASLRSSGTTIVAPAQFILGSFGIAAESGCTISAVPTAVPATPNFNIAAAANAGIFLIAGNGAARIPISGLSVSFDFPTAGALTFSVTLENDQIDLLDIGCRFYYPFAAFGPSTLASLRYPVFDRSSAKFTLNATVHPLSPLDPAATHLDFAADTPAIPSYYRGATGTPAFLKPAAGSRLVFAVRPTSPSTLAHDAYSLVPDGPFDLVDNPGLPMKTLLCGIFGSEFIQTDGLASTLTFVAGRPAYAHSFPQPELSSQATTSWAKLSGAGFRPRYSSVPEDAGFYQILNTPSPLLDYYPATAAFLPSLAETTGSGSYPMPPYAGLGIGIDECQELEIEVLSAQRREQIRLLNLGGPLVPTPNPNEPDPTDIATLTPQGLLASFSADHAVWKTLQIAQSPNGRLALDGIVEPLRSALLTKQQFIVITDPSSIAGLFTEHTLDVGGWTFNLDPAAWNQFGTIMILKNETGTLADLIEQPAKWTLASQFNPSVALAQNALRQILQNAAAALATNSNFDYFVNQVAGNPDWNGTLFLRAPLSTSQLPGDLEGIAAGIDPSRFFAHHIGVNQTPVSEQDLTSQLHSSLFGLIDYEDTSAAGTPLAPFDFHVKRLRVLFLNSAVTDFGCTVDLTVNQLFGAPVLPQGQAIELDGMYERHGDGNVLRLESAAPAVFVLNDEVLAQVTVSKTHFSTRLPPEGNQGNVQSQFAFFGSLKFRALAIDASTPFDLFSWDTLNFSNLAVTLTFPQADPTQRTFALDTSEMVVTTTASTARDHSLAGQFPLSLKAFMFSTPDNKPPAQLGYATVSIPLQHAKIDSPWFGLVYDLNLGTLGALAASEGIVASLILLWSPATSGSPPIQVGLKLPGLTGGGNQFSLFGVLKLKMNSLDLTVQVDANTGAVGYQLLLNGISLSLFGQAIPPGASFDFQVFGDSSPNATSDSLGWYGAFNPP